ncbi:ABC transporter B member 11 [Stylosanthes scabra]|uniref:ABC transporter B member 11 n=1 Tax=Stylosanthes scabra TaxID=79078 RepID=A0ABU6XI28_9FABA|nr:ABC transporter B member 11 [Stylosanthes scabra]
MEKAEGEISLESDVIASNPPAGTVQGSIQSNSEKELDSEKRKAKDEAKNKIPFYKLFSFADPLDYALLIVGTIGAVGNGMANPLMTVVFGNLIDAFGGTSNSQKVVHDVSKLALKFVYLALGSFAGSFLQVSCWIVSGERQSARIRSLYLKTILRQDASFFDTETNTGEVVGRMSSDTMLIREAMGEKVGQCIQLVASFVGSFIIAFIKGWLLTLVLMSCIPPLVLASAVMSIVIAKVTTRRQVAYSAAASTAEETISSIRTVASFTGEKQAMAKYNQSLLKAYKTGVQEGVASGLGFGSVLLIAFCTYALAIWYGGKLIIEKDYTAGKIITIIFSILMGSHSLGQASPSMSSLAAGQVAAYKMFETISRRPDIDAYDTTGRKLDDIRGDIELREVRFSYPSRPDETIFNRFSLSIPSGTTVALVGQSGSGKSTVISLIERFYDPQAGEDGATDEEIKEAVDIANASKFIDMLPQGLDTMIGEHGTQLSGGQKQRVAIARAILKDPRILLLDEATSALDAESEKTVQEALDKIMINRTTVIVAHRLSTVRNAATIAVIHQGKIVEKGSHSELIKDPDGAYSQLNRLQETYSETEHNFSVETENLESTTISSRHSSERFSFRKSITQVSSVGSFSSPTKTGVAGKEDNKVTLSADTNSEQPPKIPIRRLAKLNKPEIPVLVLGTIAAVANGIILPFFGFMVSKMVNIFFEPADELRNDSRTWAYVFIALGVSSSFITPLRSYFFSVAGEKLVKRMRLMCFEKMINMEVSWFDEAENSSGALGARLSTDAASIRALVGDALGLMVQNIATAVAGVAIAFQANWQLSLIILVLLPILALNGILQLKFLQGFTADGKKLYEEASQVATDAVSSNRTVASFCAEEKVMELYKKKCEAPIKAGIKQGIISGVGFGLSFLFLFSVYACSFYAGAKLVGDGKASFSDVFRVFFALNMAAVGMSLTSTLAPDSAKAKNAAASVLAIIDRKSKVDPNDDNGLILENLKGEVEFHHVTFKYPTRPDVQIFKDLCLTIYSGKTVALVGESGSGKSTVISLLQRFYDPDSGHITLDGIDIQKIQVTWLRQQMGLVSQEPILFNDTIRGNIAYGKGGKDATEAEIIAAAEMANAHKFISSLQQGYDTNVGERGSKLSGGQKQRVAIARAIVKNPKILLLDEATSALDAESEKVVQDALDRVMVERTTIIVAHRLSTIKSADLIAVVKNGVIVEKGNHETLINNGGNYASLVALHTSTS